MAGPDSFRTVAGETRSFAVACKYLWRAFRLHCPVCGRRPIFVPLSRVRSFSDWFTPLDGCPRCGYPYEREPGYFLLAVFGFNPGFTVFVFIVVFTIWAAKYTAQLNALPLWQFLLVVGVPIPIMNIAIARHAKALFIALDHFVDPHSRDPDDGSDDDDDDGPPLIPEPTAGGGGGGGPDDEEVWEDEPAGTRGRPREVVEHR